jgi:hypothetical protein
VPISRCAGGPLRRAIYRRLIVRSEGGVERAAEQDAGTAKAFGAYLSTEYQFARRWFAGVRLDHSERADDPSLVDKGGRCS